MIRGQCCQSTRARAERQKTVRKALQGKSWVRTLRTRKLKKCCVRNMCSNRITLPIAYGRRMTSIPCCYQSDRRFDSEYAKISYTFAIPRETKRNGRPPCYPRS